MGKPAWLERAHRARGVPSPEPAELDVEAEPDPPEFEPDVEPDVDETEQPDESDAWTRERSTCPDCGRNVAVNRDGGLRKHACAESEQEE